MGALSSNPRCTMTNKIRYMSRKAAKRAGRESPVLAGKKVQIYLCEHCDGFHISTMPRELYRKMSARKKEIDDAANET